MRCSTEPRSDQPLDTPTQSIVQHPRRYPISDIMLSRRGLQGPGGLLGTARPVIPRMVRAGRGHRPRSSVGSCAGAPACHRRNPDLAEGIREWAKPPRVARPGRLVSMLAGRARSVTAVLDPRLPMVALATTRSRRSPGYELGRVAVFTTSSSDRPSTWDTAATVNSDGVGARPHSTLR